MNVKLSVTQAAFRVLGEGEILMLSIMLKSVFCLATYFFPPEIHKLSIIIWSAENLKIALPMNGSPTQSMVKLIWIAPLKSQIPCDYYVTIIKL